MIWESTALMTVFDIAIIAISISALAMTIRYRRQIQASRRILGSTSVLLGLLLIGAFYLTDLFVMWVLPLLSSPTNAMRVMEDLHLNYSWWVVLSGTAGITLGFSRMFQRLLAQDASLQEKTEALTDMKTVLEKRVEQRTGDLQRSESRYRQIIETMTDGLGALDTEGKVTYVNDTFCRMIGYSAEEMLGQTLTKLLDEENQKISQEQLKQRAQGVMPTPFEITWTRKDGTTFPSLLSPVPIRGAADQYEGTFALVKDITEQKKSELAMKQAHDELEDRYNVLERLSPVGIFHTTPTGQCLNVNDRWSEIAGMTSEEAEGEGWIQALHPDDRERVSKQWHSDTARGRAFQAEYRFQRPDGVTTWVFGQALPNYNAESAHTGYIGTITDITELMKVEEQLKKSLEEKDQLLREIHHRVKNNLQIVSSLLNLQAGSIEDPQVLALFEESRDRIESIALIHEKLYASKDFDRTDFKGYIESLVANLAYSYSSEDRDIAFDIEVGDVSLSIETAVPCALVITELVSNAMKHAFPGDSRPENADKRVRIRFHISADDTYVLEVSDNGVGMPPGVDFDHTQTLGLHLVKTLAKQLEGELLLLPGEGTSVELRFKDLEYPART